jgi:hypothetical protein
LACRLHLFVFCDARKVADFLLIDAATQVVQCGLVAADGRLSRVLRGSGDTVDVLPNLVGELCPSKFDDKFGIVYCRSPGSTLGLRLTSVAIGVWLKFNQSGELKLYRYSSLSMAKYLAKAGVIAYCGHGKFFAESLDGEIATADSLDGYHENFCFLNTRRVVPKAAFDMNLVDYNLEHFDGNIFELAHEFKNFNASEMEYAGRDFVKWVPERHSKLDV